MFGDAYRNRYRLSYRTQAAMRSAGVGPNRPTFDRASPMLFRGHNGLSRCCAVQPCRRRTRFSVVVVTPNVQLRQALHEKLSPERWNVYQAGSGASALELLRRLMLHDAVLLLDPMLPDLEAEEFSRYRKEPVSRNPSGHDQFSDRPASWRKFLAFSNFGEVGQFD